MSGKAEQRKLAAIMFTDRVGYRRNVSKPSKTHTQLNRR